MLVREKVSELPKLSYYRAYSIFIFYKIPKESGSEYAVKKCNSEHQQNKDVTMSGLDISAAFSLAIVTPSY